MYSNMAENGGKGQGEPVQGALDILCVAEGGESVQIWSYTRCPYIQCRQGQTDPQ
jgi:hypothetical protein